MEPRSHALLILSFMAASEEEEEEAAAVVMAGEARRCKFEFSLRLALCLACFVLWENSIHSTTTP